MSLRKSWLLVLMTPFIFLACSNSKLHDKKNSPPPPEKPQEFMTEEAKLKVQQGLLAEIQANDLYQYPELTIIIFVKDVSKAIQIILENNGLVVYDPNQGNGSDISFLVVNIPTKLIADEEFFDSLNVKAATVDSPLKKNPIRIQSRPTNNSTMPTTLLEDIYVPVEDINMKEFREDSAKGTGLGEGKLVAVIDTGVDASHPIFADRVIYWFDATQETRTALAKQKVVDKKVFIAGQLVVVPDLFVGNAELFTGVLSEAKLAAQGDEEMKSEGKSLDFNRNEIMDDFLVVVGFVGDKKLPVAVVDTNTNGKFDADEINNPTVDFNLARKNNIDKYPLFLSFKSNTKLIKFPMIFELSEVGDISHISVGADFGGHGTHVAGIIAGDGINIKGVAPLAQIMSVKVCSGITCTDSALLRGLVNAFYNSSQLIPDVVNMSLGSLQQNKQDIYSYLIRDLSSKFGTSFVISASNNGPGYRTLNDIGSNSSAIHVGASASRNVYLEHYNLNPNIKGNNENLLFFSSLGPSYNGLLRPNIIAPGSALSSTPLLGSRSAMYNGTSMSAPVVSGAVLALLSRAEEDEAYKKWIELRGANIAALQKNEPQKVRSLYSMPHLVRTALEDSATRVSDLSTAQQGYGWLNMQGASTRIKSLVSSLVSNGDIFYDLKINDNSSEERVYNRESFAKASSKFSIDIEPSGMLSDEEILKIRDTSLIVKLIQLEVHSTKGAVTLIDLAKSPIKIRNFFSDKFEDRLETKVVMANRNKSSFISIHDLKQMKVGNTYIAKYEIYQNNHRINTILDVVHIPYQLQYTATHRSDGIGSSPYKASELVFERQKIKAGKTDRYFVYVSRHDTVMTVDLKLPRGQAGFMLITANGPEGNELDTVSVSSDEFENNDRRLEAKLEFSTYNKPGIYEITVSNNIPSRLMVDSAYDLVVTGTKIKPNKEKIDLHVGDIDLLTIMNLTEDKQLNLMEVGESRYATEVELEALPNMWSYVPIKMSPQFKNLYKSEQVSLIFQMKDKNDELESSLLGRIDHRLFIKKEGAFVDFEANEKVKKVSSEFLDDFARSFSGLTVENLSKQQFFIAVETLAIESKDPTKNINKFMFELLFDGPKPTLSGEIFIEFASQNDDVYLFKVTAPKSIFPEPQSDQEIKMILKADGVTSTVSEEDEFKLETPIYIRE